MAETLKVNAALTSIDLSQNELGDVACAALAEALKVNTVLTSINLAGNKIGEAGGTALADALKVNASLSSIELDYNDDIPDATKQAIEVAVAKNKESAK